MFDRISNIATGSADLFKAEGELLIERARRLVSWGGALGVGVLILTISLGALAVAGVAALSLAIGWIAALAVAGGVGLLLSSGIIVHSRRKLVSTQQRETLPAEDLMQAKSARAKIAGDRPDDAAQAKAESSSSTSTTESDDDGIKDKIAAFAVENPGLSVAGVSAVVALLGPTKTLKYAGRAVMLAGLASKMIKHAGESGEHGSSAHTPTTAPPTPSTSTQDVPAPEPAKHRGFTPVSHPVHEPKRPHAHAGPSRWNE